MSGHFPKAKIRCIYYQNKQEMEKTLAYSYRKLQQWDQWLSQQALGQYLLKLEEQQLTHFLNNHFGKHAQLIGVPHQANLLKSTRLPWHSVVSPLDHHKHSEFDLIETDLHDLPILTGSIDLVLLPHTLEFVDNPRLLLTEVCRVIKPEGLIAIVGFNPYSLWGVQKLLSRTKHTKPWCGTFIPASSITKWLKLADFYIEQHVNRLFIPPIANQDRIKQFEWLEVFGNLCFPFFGGIYIVLARAKVAPLTPIRLKWKQHIQGIGISPTISGPLIR